MWVPLSEISLELLFGSSRKLGSAYGLDIVLEGALFGSVGDKKEASSPGRGQLTYAQSMTESQCPKYKESNMFWKRADKLQKPHQETIDVIMKHTSALQEAPQEEESKVDLSEFLLQDSPKKKRSFEDMVGNDNDDVVEVLEFSEDNDTTTSLSAKVQKND